MSSAASVSSETPPPRWLHLHLHSRRSHLEKCTHVKSNTLQFGVYFCMMGWRGRRHFSRERLNLRLATSRRTATLIAAADCVSPGSVSGERRRPNHTRLAREAERRLHFLVRHRRYWKRAASYAEAASPCGRPFVFGFFLLGNRSHHRRPHPGCE